MPHVAFRCPDDFWPDEVSIQTCLDCSRTRIFRTCDYNHSLLKLMVEEQDERISPTRLSGCARQIALKRRYPYTIDPKKAYVWVRGTIWHQGIMGSQGQGVLEEQELSRELDGVLVQGRADLLETGLITDWKTVAYIRKDHEVAERHVAQLSVYRWLAEPLGIDAPYGELMYMDMTKPKRVVVKLWDTNKTVTWLRNRIPGLLLAYDQTQDRLPPVLTGKDETWMCRDCPVRSQCETHLGIPLATYQKEHQENDTPTTTTFPPTFETQETIS
jgi:CRISPR/Cas system-associated exonuclease Cas4 (RecB family)